MRKNYTFSLLGAVLLVCGACSNVRLAPVEDRQEANAPVQSPAEPGAAPAAGKPTSADNDAQREALPGPGEATDTAAPPEPLSDNPAVIALLDATDSRVSQGDREAAAGSLEQALRLEPKNPWLWHRLALLKLEQGRWRLAIALAQKSNSLSAGRPALRQANADLLRRARKRLGNR